LRLARLFHEHHPGRALVENQAPARFVFRTSHFSLVKGLPASSDFPQGVLGFLEGGGLIDESFCRVA